jgi:trimeric autotransporter adhesin
MLRYFLPLVTAAMIVPSMSSARLEGIPTLDVRPVCRGIASQSADSFGAGLKATFEECVKAEQGVHEQLKRDWPTFSAADKQHCVALATTGGESSNTELLTCLEMARDVRALRSPASTPSGADMTKHPASSPSSPTAQPAPAGQALQSIPAKESPKAEGDQMLREVARAKVEAQSAKASEAAAQRKLADAEATLQRVREHATRATAEAERAKADAKAARELEETAKRNLADSEAAKVAAEVREQACHSAAKTPLGFGTRLRSWFGIRQPDSKDP